METKVIKYYRKDVYGKTLFYIHNDNALERSAIQYLTGKTTISACQMENFKVLGLTFIEVIAP